MKKTNIRLQDKDMIPSIENNIGGRVNSVLADRFVKSDDKKILYIDANSSYGGMIQRLFYNEIKFDKNCKNKTD